MTQAANLAGTGICQAWGSYLGTGATPTLGSAFNIASVVRNSTGNLTFTFTRPMSNANYAVILSIPVSAGNTATATVAAKTTTTFTAVTQYVASLGGLGAPLDYNIDFVVFGS